MSLNPRVLSDREQNTQPIITAEPESMARISHGLTLEGSDRDSSDSAPTKEGRESTKGLKHKRSALFYPSETLAAQSNSKPFARSAAKRDSVQALGSIGHLQHLYSKQFSASGKHPFLAQGQPIPGFGLTPPDQATARAARRASRVSEASASSKGAIPEQIGAELDEEDGLLPPSPQPSGYRLPPYPDVSKSVEADYDALRPLASTALNDISHLWQLSAMEEALRPVSASDLITVTTRSIRTVRGYLVALPPEVFAGDAARLARDPVRDKDQFRRLHNGSLPGHDASFSSGPSRSGSGFLSMARKDRVNSRGSESLGLPATSSQDSDMQRSASSGSNVSGVHSDIVEDEDGKAFQQLTNLRKVTLDVLGALRDLRDSLKTEVAPGPTTRDDGSSLDVPALAASGSVGAEDRSFASGTGSSASSRRLSAAFSEMSLGAGSELSTDDGADFGAAVWKDQLLQIQQVSSQREIIRAWKTLSEQVIAHADQTIVDWRLRRIQAGRREVPPALQLDLSTSSAAGGRSTAQILSAVAAFLPSKDAVSIQSAASEMEAITKLSGGYLLCLAFNAALRASRSPWGMIQAKDIHNPDQLDALDSAKTDSVEASALTKSAWTFRRTENLLCWATSIRRRYALAATAMDERHKQMQKATSTGEQVVSPPFSAAHVAKRETGWERSLLEMISIWLDAVEAEEHEQPSPTPTKHTIPSKSQP